MSSLTIVWQQEGLIKAGHVDELLGKELIVAILSNHDIAIAAANDHVAAPQDKRTGTFYVFSCASG